MKIELLTNIYSNAQGFKLEGAGIHDVDPARAKYLLATFPDWFQPVDQDAQEPEDAQEAPETTAPTKPLSKMNKDELQALAAQIGANVNHEMTAESMRAAIKATQEAA